MGGCNFLVVAAVLNLCYLKLILYLFKYKYLNNKIERETVNRKKGGDPT
jgi:hypothetical protein